MWPITPFWFAFGCFMDVKSAREWNGHFLYAITCWFDSLFAFTFIFMINMADMELLLHPYSVGVVSVFFCAIKCISYHFATAVIILTQFFRCNHERILTFNISHRLNEILAGAVRHVAVMTFRPWCMLLWLCGWQARNAGRLEDARSSPRWRRSDRGGQTVFHTGTYPTTTTRIN